MLKIQIKEKGRWKDLPNGPFPIRGEELDHARCRFVALQKEATTFGGARMAPATTARGLLLDAAPGLSNFDLICLAYAVTIEHVRWEEVGI